MGILIKAERLYKSYQQHQALHNVSFELHTGQIFGLLGHNGAGKSTLIKSLLGTQAFDGKLSVFGLHPQKDRVKVVNDLAYISDVAVLPDWMTVKQILKYMAGVHPSFERYIAEQYLNDTDIHFSAKIASLSKGMKVQLHLAIVMATNVRVLILDEPTLGLDLMYREVFYRSLMSWFREGERALIIASHEVAEIEHLLTDVLVLRKGKTVLQAKVDELESRFAKLTVIPETLDAALSLAPLYHRPGSNKHELIFEATERSELESLGEVSSASLADIFIATQQEVRL